MTYKYRAQHFYSYKYSNYLLKMCSFLQRIHFSRLLIKVFIIQVHKLLPQQLIRKCIIMHLFFVFFNYTEKNNFNILKYQFICHLNIGPWTQKFKFIIPILLFENIPQNKTNFCKFKILFVSFTIYIGTLYKNLRKNLFKICSLYLLVLMTNLLDIKRQLH